MKHQHNELPLMKNLQTRRKTPKVAPLLALALVLLTIIPIYYPYIQYYIGRSPLPPSSSSSLCQDNLSGDISECSHQDVDKPTDRDGNLVDANQRLATTEEKHASTSDNTNLETQYSNQDSRNEVERSKKKESGTDVGRSATNIEDANVERWAQNEESNTGVERSVDTDDETSPEKWTRNEETNTDAERSTTTTTTTGDNDVERSSTNDEANVERSATTTTTDDNAVEMSATANDEPSGDRSIATTDGDNDRERSATTSHEANAEKSATTTGFNDEANVERSATTTTDDNAVEISVTTNDEPSGDSSTATNDRDNGRERSSATTSDEANAERSATSTTTSDMHGDRSAATKDETNSERQTKNGESDTNVDKSEVERNPNNEESSTNVEGGGATSSNDSDGDTQEKNQENPSTGDSYLRKESSPGTNQPTKNATKLAKPEKANKQGRKELPKTRKKVVVTPPVDKNCDLFSGEWVPNPEGPYYTNLTCREIQEHQNCMKFGRPDTQYLKWKWKPDGCELPIFDPFQFLEIVRGKSLAFVGDSVARNHMQSLICLLSRVEEPVDISDVPYGSQFKRYQYVNYNFTIEIFWSPYLVRTTQTDEQNSSPFNLYLDEFDEKWTTKIEPFDYVIISAGHWFFRPTMFYVEGNLVGCLYCDDWVNIKHLTTYFSYRRAFRTAFRAINSLENYKGITFLRTFAPSHFEGGYWNSGGNCPRKKPFKRSEGRLEGYNNELYKIQTDEIKIANRMGRRKRLRYRLFDVTQAMLLRPDGHPSQYGHWPQANVSLTNDCVHWCLPGPVDAWNDFLLELLKREEVH